MLHVVIHLGMPCHLPTWVPCHGACTLQVKAKGARKITYDAFLKALDHVAAKKVGRSAY
jgi:hypothetical protein